MAPHTHTLLELSLFAPGLHLLTDRSESGGQMRMEEHALGLTPGICASQG